MIMHTHTLARTYAHTRAPACVQLEFEATRAEMEREAKRAAKLEQKVRVCARVRMCARVCMCACVPLPAIGSPGS